MNEQRGEKNASNENKHVDGGKEDQEEEVKEREREREREKERKKKENRQKWTREERLRLILAILDTILTVTRTLERRGRGSVGVKARDAHNEQ